MEYTKNALIKSNDISGDNMLDIIQYIKKDKELITPYSNYNLKDIIYRLIFIEEEDNTYSNVNIVCEYNFMIALALYKNKYNEDYYIDWKKPAKSTYQDLAYLIILNYYNIKDDYHFIKVNKELL
tara:strand:- start:5282 stop:5656 length:375 start_codon:yes stop_codon:yes gene_type:complete